MPTIINGFEMILYMFLLILPIFFTKTKVKVLDFLMVIMYIACSTLAIRYVFYLIFITYISMSRYILAFIKSNSKDSYNELVNFKFSLKGMIISFCVICIVFMGIISPVGENIFESVKYLFATNMTVFAAVLPVTTLYECVRF